MSDDNMNIARKQVMLIPTSQIHVINPRVRNRRTFEKIVRNIAKVGLKRPITVSRVLVELMRWNMILFVARAGWKLSWN